MTTTKKPIRRPPFEGLYPYLVFIFLGYCVADLLQISMRSALLPTQVPPVHARPPRADQFPSPGSFSSITTRNLFSVDGSIPDSLAQRQQKDDKKNNKEKEQIPVPSSLPLNLVGTIVHSNPEKSIANVDVKSKNTVMAIRVGKDIEKIATLIKVERAKIIIRNLNNQRLEFIEIKEKNKLSFNAAKAPAPVEGKQEVKMTSQNQFEISRSDVLKYTSDMSTVLQQAAMQPRRKASGEIDCFKFLSIQPKSIFTQLAFQSGDCIKAVNGEPVDSPAKAMEMYNLLKGASDIKITFERDGRDTEHSYHVK